MLPVTRTGKEGLLLLWKDRRKNGPEKIRGLEVPAVTVMEVKNEKKQNPFVCAGRCAGCVCERERFCVLSELSLIHI